MLAAVGAASASISSLLLLEVTLDWPLIPLLVTVTQLPSVQLVETECPVAAAAAAFAAVMVGSSVVAQ